MRRSLLLLAIPALAAIPLLASALAPETPTQSSLRYQVEGSLPRWHHRILPGPVKEYLGVAMEPVDSMVWDGKASKYIDGWVSVDVDPVHDTGLIEAEWTDDYGHWTYRQDFFAHPHHPSGLRIGPDANETEFALLDAIATNVYLHGNTEAAPPAMPTTFTLLACWGLAEVTLDGQPFENWIDGIPPYWDGHMMLTVGARQQDGTVRTVDGGIYDMSKATEGYTDPLDLELHLVFHDAPGPMTRNVPPLFQFFYHLVFEDVEIQISHHDVFEK